jgi:hypothetical protein
MELGGIRGALRQGLVRIEVLMNFQQLAQWWQKNTLSSWSLMSYKWMLCFPYMEFLVVLWAVL